LGARLDIGNLDPQCTLFFDETPHLVAMLSALQALVLGNAVGVAESNFAFDRSITLSKFADQAIDGGDLIHKLLSVHGAYSNWKIDATLNAAYGHARRDRRQSRVSVHASKLPCRDIRAQSASAPYPHAVPSPSADESAQEP
jgi:hypothetical protein